jgi:hypothetical protein
MRFDTRCERPKEVALVRHEIFMIRGKDGVLDDQNKVKK